ncbi:chemotaxis protein CheX [Fodinibius saliphilus]|uniref:chemotaxis protein CheX n=1 Tax=Fodinibius saliphilus TaxID=1920650 RepID=UPI001109B211|nr:chemotaxis protein CheX [Fodinibius saliphilus]
MSIKTIDRIENLDEIPVEIAEKVQESVINTFGSIIGEELSYIDEANGDGALNGIIGNVTVFNSEHTLSLMLAIPKETAVYFSEVFIGMPLPFESDDMGDLIGEISNILAGDVAANVEKVGFRGQSSLPTATRGSDLTLFMPNKPPTKKMKFASANSEFWLTMVLSESK